MAQHDYNIANQSGADFRADLNNALSAIATVNSGASEPSTTFAHQLWVDTSNNVLKIRNAANSAFITTGISITADNTFTGALTGNATTATTLQTARTINGVSFNGSANISFGTDSVAEGSSNLYFTNERVDDRVDDLLVAGTGISLTYDDGSNTLTIANTNDADITGVFSGAALTGGGTSGDVTLNVAVDDSSIEINSDALRIKASGITNAMLAGSIANSKLSNSSVTINSQSLALGGSLDLDTSEIPESGNLYYTTARANTDFDTRLGTKDTNDLTEGSNLYYTTARANTDFDTRLGTKSTSNLTEGSNLYYTDARVNSAFDTRLGTKDTDDVSEGTTNLYYTTARANTDFDTRLGTKSTSNLAEGTNLYYTTARFDSAFTSKDTDDLSEGTSNLYYTQSRFNSAFSNKTTADLTENTNLYYTDTRANSAIDARVTKSFVDALGIQATSVADNSVVLGNDTTGNYIQTITGTANKITVSGSGSETADVTLSLPDDVQIADSLTVAGNLTVNGTLTSLDTTNLDIEDNLFQLNAGLTGSPVNDSGMLINRGNANNSIFMWDESVDKFTLGLTTADGSATGNITLSALGTLVANLEGNVTGQVSDISNFTTANLNENTNLYYTDARSRAAISATGDISYNSSTGVISFTQSASPVTSVNTLTGAVVLDTDDIGEGSTNIYFSNARADTRINLQTGANLDLSSKSTTNLSEGSNLYYTDARVQAVSINNVVEDTTPQLGGDLASNGNDILFADSDKAIFGAGSDLQIYHDGSNSYIDEVGTGRLYIRAANNLTFTNADTTKTYANFENAGAAKLYYNSVLKIATTTAGAEVRESLTIGSSVNNLGGTAGNQLTPLTLRSETSNTDSLLFTTERLADGTDWTTAAHRIQRKVDATKMGYIQFGSSAADTVTFGEGSIERMRLDGNGKLGLGTDSPDTIMEIRGADPVLTIRDVATSIANANATLRLAESDGSDTLGAYFDIAMTGQNLTFGHATAGSADSEQMRLEGSTGDLGIGTTNPLGKLHVNGDIIADANANNGFGFERSGVAYSMLELSATAADELSLFNKLNNDLVFGTNSTERARIDNAGNFGIGTTSPARLLHISGTDSTQLELEQTSASSDVRMLLDAGGTNGQIQFAGASHASIPNTLTLSSAADTRFVQAGQTVMHIDSASGGKVGIGTTSPAAVLEVEGSPVATGDTRYELILSENNTASAGRGGGLAFARQGVIYGGIKTLQDTSSDSNASMYFQTVTGGSNTTKMTIDSSGNVGIGTTSPEGTLHVENASNNALIMNAPANRYNAIGFQTAGTDKWWLGRADSDQIASDAFFIGRDAGNATDPGGLSAKLVIDSSGNVGIGNTNPADYNFDTGVNLVVGSSSTNGQIQVLSGTSGIGYLAFADGVTGAENYRGLIQYHHGSNYMGLRTNGSERMRINSSGNVGIGTDSPAQKLHLYKSSGNVLAQIQSGSSGVAGLTLQTSAGASTIFAGVGSAQGLMFYANGTSEAMRINSSGNLGLGTTSPSSGMQIKGDGKSLKVSSADYDIGFLGALGSGGTSLDKGYFYLKNTGTTKIQLHSDGDSYFNGGNVGIGTDSPDTNLEILGTDVDDSSPTIRLTNSKSTSAWQDISGDMGRLEFFTSDTSGNAPYVTSRITCNNDALSGGRTLPSGALNFWTRGYNASSLTLAMTLSSGGALSKASGSFKIDHPLESKTDTHHLVHSFVEAPQADNIYRGVVTLVNGSATINLDTEAGMTEGTYVVLNTNTSCFTSNETDWDAVKGSVSGNILTISCQNTSSTATVSWLVIGERHDQHMIDTDWTDENGKVIVEPTK